MREELDRSIEELRELLADMAERADAMLGDAAAALVAADRVRAAAVVSADGAVDERYTSVQQQVLATIALQGPVGRDLRLLSAFLHVSLHLERMADHGVSIAKAVQRSAELPSDPELLAQLSEMTGYAREVAAVAVRALMSLDATLARTVPTVDDSVDQLNIGIFHRLVALAAAQEEQLPWAAEMIGVARRVERFADHAVDIAEQVIFAVTGEIIELSSNEAH
jgi:phosphate transport system protein